MITASERRYLGCESRGAQDLLLQNRQRKFYLIAVDDDVWMNRRCLMGYQRMSCTFLWRHARKCSVRFPFFSSWRIQVKVTDGTPEVETFQVAYSTFHKIARRAAASHSSITEQLLVRLSS
jgi:hypothetical protein